MRSPPHFALSPPQFARTVELLQPKLQSSSEVFPSDTKSTKSSQIGHDKKEEIYCCIGGQVNHI